MVRSFFCGHELPRYITCTNLVLLPKNKEINTSSDMRPISLSNFTSNVFSSLVQFLPSIISPQQSGFVKCRSFVEHIILVQEIVHDIRIRGKPANVVIKLDMAKSYDRIFKKGKARGSTISYSFYTRLAECLSGHERYPFNEVNYKKYVMPNGVRIDHFGISLMTLLIIFTSANEDYLRLVVETLTNYDKVSGQRVNKHKMRFYMHHLTSQNIKAVVHNVTKIPEKEFHFTYLGVPVYYGRRMNIHYKEMIEKIQNRLSSWTGKFLSIGERITLIKHVLQSVTIHLLSACDPPHRVLAQIHRLFAKFFFGATQLVIQASIGQPGKLLCHPTEEGGMGFRSLQNMSKSLFIKLWWNMRTK
ncbi:uncharacterized protein LOC132057781 [Lycium ferocissimum]|uniref:uncharacterized protein LOC132057781 n=1 Tax=Lycium ferocissimum TaxID=112874 RepID=UPI0028149A8A|nr:uncharacterized protein LOC132057781 [Lycium ferocissimum]